MSEEPVVADIWGGAVGVRRRATWSLADQALSSATNFAVGLIAAHALSPRDFGAFALAFTTYVLFLNLCHAFGTDALIVRYSASTEAERRAVVPAVMGAVMVFALVATACNLAAAAVLPAPASIAFLVFAPAQFGVLIQDAWRFVFFADGRPQVAAANDLVWALVQGVLTIALFAAGRVSLPSLVLAWGAGAWLAGAIGFLQAKSKAAPREAMTWIRANRDLAFRFAADVLSFLGVAQLGIYSLGVVAGLKAVASIRAAQVVLGPLTFVIIGGGIIAVPEGVRLRAKAPHRLQSAMATYSGLLVAVSAAWLTVILVLGPAIAQRVIGENWAGAHVVLVPVGAGFVLIGLGEGGLLGLRILGDARSMLRARLLVAPFTLVVTILGAALAAARGFAIAGAVAWAVSSLVWWITFHRSQARDLAVPDPGSSSLPTAPLSIEALLE